MPGVGGSKVGHADPGAITSLGSLRLRLPVVEHTVAGSRSRISVEMVRPPILYVIGGLIPAACRHPEDVNGLAVAGIFMLRTSRNPRPGSAVEGFVRLPRRAHDVETHFPCRVDPSCRTPLFDGKTE